MRVSASGKFALRAAFQSLSKSFWGMFRGSQPFQILHGVTRRILEAPDLGQCTAFAMAHPGRRGSYRGGLSLPDRDWCSEVM